MINNIIAVNIVIILDVPINCKKILEIEMVLN